MPRSRVYRFGPFTLDRQERILRQGERALQIGEKATELLFALVENSTEVVGKAELMRRAWPDSSVDESTLRFHIAGLRKALGDGSADARYIVNVSGRGYCFVAAVESSADPEARRESPAHLPLRGSKLLGREKALDDLTAMLPQHRFVSVVGPGGMGKSSLAFALADRLCAAYPDGIFMLDVALIGDEALVASTLAHQAGVSHTPGAALEALCRWFRNQRALILFDSCETQLEACAATAKALLEQAADVHVLTTSREALRVKGEWVLQLKPLAMPAPPWTVLDRRAVLGFPAVQLVIERAQALQPGFAVSDSELPLVCELVNRLDGMPLAIELASVWLHTLSMNELLEQLERKFLLRNGGIDAGIDRHRTLGELLDWSYDRLGPDEQTVLRRLSVCNGAFTLDTAQAVAADHGLSEPSVIEAVASLEMKSLLSVDSQGPEIRYRLLDSTRAYAAERLGEGDEYRMVRVQQCVHLHDTMLRAEQDSAELAPPDWMNKYAAVNHDMRANIAWAFGPRGDVSRGIRLVAASIRFAHQLALAEEYGVHVRLALERLPSQAKPEPAVEIALLGGLFVLHMLSRGPGSEMWKAHARVQELAEQLDSNRYRVEALNGQFVQTYFGHGDYPAAKALADSVAMIAAGVAEVSPQVERLRLQALHGLGRHEEARLGLEAILRKPPPRQRLRPPFPIDMSVMAGMLLIRIHWLQGRADDALGMVAELQDRAARDVKFALANCHAWSICPLLFWCGDHARARHAIDEMHRQACAMDMPFTTAWACAFDLAWSRITGHEMAFPASAGAAAEASSKGVVAELLGTIDVSFLSPALLERQRQGTLGWCAPEIARAEGERLLLDGGDAQQARGLFESAMRLAQSQGALAWELRAATSLARLLVRQHNEDHARAVLEPVYRRFKQGFSTADLRAATAILAPDIVH